MMFVVGVIDCFKGDKKSDIEAGAAAGIGLRILIGSRNNREREGASPHEMVADLGEALALLRSHFASAPRDRRFGHP